MKLRVLLVGLLALLAAVPVQAGVPNLLAWQGVVLDSLDQPITDGEYSMHFAVYNAAVGGDSLWGESQLVLIQDGVANVMLGGVVPLADTLFDDSLRYLQVQFDNEAPYTPRVQLVSVGFAHRVQSVHGARGGLITGDVDLGEDLVVAGSIRSGSKATLGPDHTNTGANAFVAGIENLASGAAAVVGGGYRNQATHNYATVAGGIDNTADGNYASVSGGIDNLAGSNYGVVSGGQSNIVNQPYGTVGGGYQNAIGGLGSTVAGGLENTANGVLATIPGGRDNVAQGSFSLAAGRRAQALHAGAFVWGDSTDMDFASTAANQFLIRAHGGVGIGTSAPSEALEVAGRIYSSAGGIKFPDGSVQTSAWAQPPSGWAKFDSVVRLDASGDLVGIGTNAPTEKLEIDGNVKATGTVHVGRFLEINGDSARISSQTGTIDFGHADLQTTGRAMIGPDNTMDGTGTFVAGGNNSAVHLYSTISGGRWNDATAGWTTICGGSNNATMGEGASIGGGVQNVAAGIFSTVPGGHLNIAMGDFSLAAGFRARAEHLGSFVWADSSENQFFISTAPNQFLLRAQGGVGIGTDSPTTALEVAGTIYSSTGGIKFPDGSVQATAASAPNFVWGRTGNAVHLDVASDSVGIGTMVPTERLEVDGNIKASGMIRAGNSILINGTTGEITNWFGTVSFGSDQITTTGKARIGPNNTNGGLNAFVAGGGNSSGGAYSSVVGGQNNQASGQYATVAGGFDNAAAGNNSFAAGTRAEANHSGSFVWADSIGLTFASTAPNQFLIRADGGVGIGTNAPEGQLHVAEGAIFNDWTHGSDTEPSILVENLHDGITSPLGTGVWGVAASAARNSGAFKLALAGIAKGDDGTKYGVYGSAAGNGGTKYAVYGTVNGPGTNYAGYFVGDAAVTGNLSKGGGSFKIDHPLDPENKYLYHSFVESPDMMNVYNGNVMLDASGAAAVELPDYFEALNRDFRYQLTAIGGAAPNLHIASRIEGGRFSIAGGAPGLEVSWQVTGVRKDAFAEAHRIPVEELKPSTERGRYLHPAAHGLSRERGIHAGDSRPTPQVAEQEVR